MEISTGKMMYWLILPMLMEWTSKVLILTTLLECILHILTLLLPKDKKMYGMLFKIFHLIKPVLYSIKGKIIISIIFKRHFSL